jgi:hypothetical protein
MMPDNIPQETWKKADEFLDALANGTTDAQQLAAKDAEIAKLQEIVRTQAEEAAKATYYYTDKMDELKKERDALAGALREIAETDLLEVKSMYRREFSVPETGNTYHLDEPIFARSPFQNAHHFQNIAHTTLAQHKGDA